MQGHTSRALRKDTLDFILDHTKHAPEAQLQALDALDTKVVHLLSVASVIIGLTTFAVDSGPIARPASLFLAIAFGAYVVLAVGAILHLRPKQVHRVFHADVLWNDYWDKDIQSIKHSLVADIADAYAHNDRVLCGKSRTLLLVVVCAAIEVVFVGLLAISLGLPWNT